MAVRNKDLAGLIKGFPQLWVVGIAVLIDNRGKQDLATPTPHHSHGPILVTPTRKSNKLVFSIGSMMVITFVVAIVGLLLGRMFIAGRSGETNSVGYFAILAAVAPTAALVGAGTTFRVLQWIQRQGK